MIKIAYIVASILIVIGMIVALILAVRVYKRLKVSEDKQDRQKFAWCLLAVFILVIVGSLLSLTYHILTLVKLI